IIVQQFDGMIPDTETALKHLPGLGRYGVAAVLNFAFSVPKPMVDGNILHLFRRVFGLSLRGVDDEEAWSLAQRLGGRHQPPELYWGMIDLVAQVCLRRRPRCEQCPLSARCKYCQHDSAAS
ncbi:MAG: A/G-specific adenine glycosylase, partial [Candidatus Thorarchaeota archaeon]